ncbi:hypothetical protein QA23_5156 [Saccharomyces cerevisiae Lalvin QA23]|nr:hypothetical protein QA23_5156 [Saccharomyces cerevisiae Lalvin QA23]
MTISRAKTFMTRLSLKYPIIQAPMAGVTTPEMVADVCKFGGLGSLPVSHIDLSSSNGFSELEKSVQQVQSMISDNSARRNINLNFFCQDVAKEVSDEQKDNWFRLYERAMGKKADENKITFDTRSVSFKDYEDTPTFSNLLSFFKEKDSPKVISFHFGHPSKPSIEELQKLGVSVLLTTTSDQEIRRAIELKVDGIVCQGYEAGGHRGNYLETDQRLDEKLSTALLTLRAVRALDSNISEVPFIISAGGIGSSGDIEYMLSLGASAVQLGTVFLATKGSKASSKFRSLLSEKENLRETVMIDLVSGKPARAILTPFIRSLLLASSQENLPDYSYRYNAFKQLKLEDNRTDFILAGQGYQSINSQLEMQEILKSLVKGLK